MIPSARLKTEEHFRFWLTTPEGSRFVKELLSISAAASAHGNQRSPPIYNSQQHIEPAAGAVRRRVTKQSQSTVPDIKHAHLVLPSLWTEDFTCTHMHSSTQLPLVLCAYVANWLSKTGPKSSTNEVDPTKYHEFCVTQIEHLDKQCMLWNILHTCGAGLHNTEGDHKFLFPCDLRPLILHIVEHHPGLEALREAPDFIHNYCDLVIVRLFRETGKCRHGVFTQKDLLHTHMLSLLTTISNTSDLGGTLLSYQDFCVVFYKFWELDFDHDQLLSSRDISNYNGYRGVTSCVAERVAAFHPVPLKLQDISPELQDVILPSGVAVKGLITFMDWAWFLMSEEDKGNPASVWYWFCIADADQDGRLSLYEIQLLFDNVNRGLAGLGDAPIELPQMLRELLDMVNATRSKNTLVLTLKDLQSSNMGREFFTALTSPAKLLELEDHINSSKVQDETAPSSEQRSACSGEWDRFVAEEYTRYDNENEDEDDE